MIDEKEEKLTEMVEKFCDEYLNDDYKLLSQKLIDEMANGKTVYFKKGKLEVWASAIIYALCQVNSAFDETNDINIVRKDILNYFNTKQTNVLRKAVNLRNIYDLDDNFTLDNIKEHNFEDVEDRIYENIMEHNFGDNYPMSDNGDMTVEDYQKIIDNYKQEFGEKFFKEHEGDFWLIYETRPFMQCLYDQAQLLWITGKKERAINQYKYMLKLNPNDNQGVRNVLFPNLLELNRLDEAKELYLQYEDDFTANWKYCKLLLDIKNKVSFDEIEMEYMDCIKANPHIVPYLLGKKELPDKLPLFYGLGDDNEAVFHILLAGDAWYDDKRAMKVLMKLSKK